MVMIWRRKDGKGRKNRKWRQNSGDIPKKSQQIFPQRLISIKTGISREISLGGPSHLHLNIKQAQQQP